MLTSNLSVAEAHTAKLNLAAEIQSLIVSYEELTGLQVGYVTLTRLPWLQVSEVKETNVLLVSVEVKL